MKKTANYGLNQWEKTDRIQMEDFNADNAKIEAALNQATEIAISASKLHFGTYKGTSSSSQTISLGFTPKIVLVCTVDGTFTSSSDSHFGGLAFTNIPCSISNSKIIEIVNQGFIVYYNSSSKAAANANRTYHYIAVE